jgi:hypothetical protein
VTTTFVRTPPRPTRRARHGWLSSFVSFLTLGLFLPLTSLAAQDEATGPAGKASGSGAPTAMAVQAVCPGDPICGSIEVYTTQANPTPERSSTNTTTTYTAGFRVTNAGTATAQFTFTCVANAHLTCVSVSPTAANLAAERSATVTVSYRVKSAGNGQLWLRATRSSSHW